MKLNSKFIVQENIIFLIYIISILSISISLFSMALSSILGVLSFLISIIYLLKFGVIYTNRRFLFAILVTLPFWLTILSLLYSINNENTIDEIFKQINIFTFSFPLFFLPKLEKSKNELVLSLFSYIVLFGFLISWMKGIQVYVETERFLYFGDLHRITVIQHNYLGLFGVFTCGFFLKKITSNNSLKLKVGYVFFLLSITSFIILISSRTSIILVFVLFIIFGIQLFKNKKKHFKQSFIIIFVLIAMLLYNSSNTFLRFKRAFGSEHNPRSVLWQCSFDLIKEHSNFFYGLGSNNIQSELNDCISSSTDRVDYVGLHTHNQTLSFLLQFGYLQTFILTCVIFYFFWIAFKTKNSLFIYFIISIILLGLTENFLSRRYGQIYYSFFISFYLINISKNILSNKKNI